MSKFKILAGGIVALLLVLAAILTVNTLKVSKAVPPATAAKLIDVDPAQAAQTLSRAVQFKTVTMQNASDTDWAEFERFQAWLQETFTDFYDVATTERVAELTLYQTWQGSDPSLAPIVFLAHQDVVPALESDAGWDYPPFEGRIADGFIYGRGTLDDKGSLVGLLEAANRLASTGYTPKRTLIFIFGHDEETSGSGALTAAQRMEAEGLRPYAVYDEGGAIVSGLGIAPKPAAVIGVAEKGYMTLVLTATADGGHSSTPPEYTAIGALSRAIAAIEANPFTRDFDPVSRRMLQAIAPGQSLMKRMAIGNLWLFGGVVKQSLMENNTTRAMLGTTIAPTIIDAGFKENALPREASAYVNFRIHNRDSRASVIAHVRRVINNPAIDVRETESLGSEPSPISQINGGPFELLTGVVRGGFPDLAILPNTLTGATDSRHFTSVTSDIYRFMPIAMNASDMSGIHGLNERVSVESYAKGIQVYYLFLSEAGG